MKPSTQCLLRLIYSFCLCFSHWDIYYVVKQVLDPVCSLSGNLRSNIFPEIFGTEGSQLYIDWYLALVTGFRMKTFLYQLSASSCAHYLTSVCLFPLALCVSTEYSDYKFFQSNILILTLHTLKLYVCQSKCIMEQTDTRISFISIHWFYTLTPNTKCYSRRKTPLLRMNMGI